MQLISGSLTICHVPINHTSVLRGLSLCSPKLSSGLVDHFGRGNDIKFLLNLRIGANAPYERASYSSLTPLRVKHEDTEETLSEESMILDEQTLEKDLQIAIKEENYAQAVKLRDSLRLLHEDNKASVMATNTRFYNAFMKGDLAAMQKLWGCGGNVCCVHPGAQGISGYDLIMESWEFVFSDYGFPLKIELSDVRVHVRGDLGYVTCIESVKTKGSSWGRQFATNVFERIDGRWFICIHHASRVDL